MRMYPVKNVLQVMSCIAVLDVERAGEQLRCRDLKRQSESSHWRCFKLAVNMHLHKCGHDDRAVAGVCVFVCETCN